MSNPSLFKRLGPAGPIALAAVILPLVGWLVIPANMDRIAPWLREHRAEGLAIYLAGFVLLTALALMPTHLLAALGGFAFGMAWGVPASVLGFVLGAALGYEIARLASKGRVLQIIDDNPRWRAVKLALLGARQSFGRTLWMVPLTRLPLTPFAAVNLLHAGVGVARGFVIIVPTRMCRIPHPPDLCPLRRAPHAQHVERIGQAYRHRSRRIWSGVRVSVKKWRERHRLPIDFPRQQQRIR